jgi:Lar family restriction alleviation protein
MTNTPRLPCPFCGEPEIVMAAQRENWWQGECPNCGATGPLGREVAGAVQEWNSRDQAESALAAATAREHTLRTGCAAALIDWQYQKEVDAAAGSPRPGGNDFLEGCVAVYQTTIGLLQAILDGTVVDNDFDEAEYASMLASGATSLEALKAVHEAENERIRAEVRGVASLPERAPGETQ